MSKSLEMTKATELLFFFFLTLFGSHLTAQVEFPGLKYTSFKDSTVTIGVNPENFKPVFKDTLPSSELLNKIGKQFIYLGDYKDTSLNCKLLYSQNEPENIPELCVVTNDSILFRGPGNKFHFKGNTLYTEGISNQMFNLKKKFTLIDGRYQEIKQPMYYIGIKGNLKTPIQLFQSQKNTAVLANLPTGYPIEIVSAYYNKDSDLISQLLIKTKFGLIGWIPMKINYLKGNLLQNFYYHDTLK